MPDYRDILEKLIAFDTVSSNSNMALINWVKDYLAEYGVDSVLFEDRAEPKANLLATIGPKDSSGILLSGHTDVVPVDGQAWTSDPFRMEERAGKLFGRGSTDMKGFLALMLSLVPDLVRRKLKMPVHLAFSYDEECGCSGVMPLVEHVAAAWGRPATANKTAGRRRSGRECRSARACYAARCSETGWGSL